MEQEIKGRWTYYRFDFPRLGRTENDRPRLAANIPSPTANETDFFLRPFDFGVLRIMMLSPLG